MNGTGKQRVLQVCKAVGLFALARRLTRNKLRILGYHGFSLADEHRFRGRLFMSRETFARRLQLLQRRNYPVLGLADALQRRRQGTLPANATVITIDDGWCGVFDRAFPELHQRNMPATLYVTSYFVVNRYPLFNVFIDYLFWKTEVPGIDLAVLDQALDGHYDLRDPAQRELAADRVRVHAEQNYKPAEKQRLLGNAMAALNIDQTALPPNMFMLLSADQIRDLDRRGLDIQLHTHKHRLGPPSEQLLREQVLANRECLAPITTRPLQHFCYPSGNFTAEMADWLARLQISSAVTTATGLCGAATPTYFLPRILDEEALSDIEFEAEMCGFLELVRDLRGRAAG